jgi:GntR family transcriptional regulator
MILSIDPSRALPVYEQVREQIGRMVASGVLRSGAKLPTIRQLAADLGLAKGTIERAYELLEVDTLVESKGRHGTFVRGLGARAAADQGAGLAAAAESLVVTARQLGADEDSMIDAIREAWRNL